MKKEEYGITMKLLVCLAAMALGFLLFAGCSTSEPRELEDSQLFRGVLREHKQSMDQRSGAPQRSPSSATTAMVKSLGRWSISTKAGSRAALRILDGNPSFSTTPEAGVISQHAIESIIKQCESPAGSAFPACIYVPNFIHWEYSFGDVVPYPADNDFWRVELDGEGWRHGECIEYAADGRIISRSTWSHGNLVSVMR